MKMESNSIKEKCQWFSLNRRSQLRLLAIIIIKRFFSLLKFTNLKRPKLAYRITMINRCFPFYIQQQQLLCFERNSRRYSDHEDENIKLTFMQISLRFVLKASTRQDVPKSSFEVYFRTLIRCRKVSRAWNFIDVIEEEFLSYNEIFTFVSMEK